MCISFRNIRRENGLIGYFDGFTSHLLYYFINDFIYSQLYLMLKDLYLGAKNAPIRIVNTEFNNFSKLIYGI